MPVQDTISLSENIRSHKIATSDRSQLPKHLKIVTCAFNGNAFSDHMKNKFLKQFADESRDENKISRKLLVRQIKLELSLG